VKLLKAGKLTRPDSLGGTLLDNLHTLRTQSYPAPLQAGEVLRETLGQLADPHQIHQGNRGTCTVTCMEFLMARQDPAEYARLIAGLTSPEGQVRMRNGEMLARDEGPLGNDGSTRSAISRIFQSAAMEYANGPNVDYVTRTQGENWVIGPAGSRVLRRDHGGLVDREWSLAASALLPYAGHTRTIPVGPDRMPTAEGQAAGMTEIGAILDGGNPVLVSLNFVPGGRGSHMMVVDRLEDGYVYVRNPSVFGDPGSDGSDGTPPRQRLDRGQPGEMRMRVEDFQRFLRAYTAAPR
jgi:hypothetical protein